VAKLSVLMTAYNSEGVITECLDSVAWADEIVVCDSYSTDRTLEICSRYTDHIIQHEYVNAARQKNWAIGHCTHEWVLVIDTDERVEPSLRLEIQAFLKAPPDDVNACRMRRKNMIVGQWVCVADMWPDFVTRLVRRDVARCDDREVHEDFYAPGRLVTFEGAFVHHGTPTLAKQIGQLDRYTRYQSDQFRKEGRRFAWWRILVRPPAAFAYYYLFRRGSTAGFRGFFLAAHAAIYSFYTYAQLWEHEERERQTRTANRARESALAGGGNER
jgi:glycosyltransferase involved in cell wall biosynthesis